MILYTCTVYCTVATVHCVHKLTSQHGGKRCCQYSHGPVRRNSSETIESETIESETIVSETIESETIESETIESETIESEIGFETRI